MRRNLSELVNQEFDLLVIGGGIHGACVAWEASLRGLSVALVEKSDFGSATSANSLKVIHGGLRYLQHADFRRMRQSIAERKSLLRIAPHLIHPLPVLVPTYGHSLKGIEAMACALKINDLVSFDRNLNLEDIQKHIPSGSILSKQDCLNYLPDLPRQGLTGGALFYDAQVYNSERLLISFLKSAAEAGSNIANYVEVTGFLQSGNQITGVTAQDKLSGNCLEIRAKAVINTSGPWINCILDRLNHPQSEPKVKLAKAINLVINRPLFDDFAVGLSSRNSYHDPDAVINKGSRLFFIAPWRGKSLVGTAYTPFDGNPEDLTVTDSEIQTFLDDVNQVYPFNLKREEVSLVHKGLLPRSGINSKTGDVQLTKHFKLYDHSAQGVNGLLSVVGVKYTTARHVAEKAVDWSFTRQGQKPRRSASASTKIYGGEIDHFEGFFQEALQKLSCCLEAGSIRRLVYNYGSAYPNVLKYCDDYLHHGGNTSISDLEVWQAEVRYCIKEEMAQTLRDVVLRRTDLGSDGSPNESLLVACAQAMGDELNWGSNKLQEEIQFVQVLYNKNSFQYSNFIIEKI
jgi:glycerol-3-phosphate dehydrogenase